jgi:flagellar P-ring protein precursor FlgI
LNKQFAGAAVARAANSSVVGVRVPPDFSARTAEFIAEMEGITVEADRAAKIVINERTGTVTLGKDVVVAPVAIMHGGLTVEVRTTFEVSQPNPLSQGTTTTVPKIDVGVREERARDIVLQNGATIEQLVKSLNAVGATSRDIIAILQGLKSAGALDADLEVI